MAVGRVLVTFGTELPRERELAYDLVIAPEALAQLAAAHGLAFEALEQFVGPGSVVEAATFAGELARTTLQDGTPISKSVVYEGYELWWIGYDDIFFRQCLPYTQYRRLLERLAEFSEVTLEKPPATSLFRSYLEAHGCRCVIHEEFSAFPPFGTWLQVLLSLVSWPLLVLMRPAIMVYTGDRFDPVHDHSSRMRFIYDELRARKLPFVEFIRSLEPSRTVLAHAWRRRRPVIYSYAIKVVLMWITAGAKGPAQAASRSGDPNLDFRRALAATYVRNVRGTVWSIRAMNLLARSIGVRAALIPAGSARTFHEVLGCKLAGIPTIGILHGAPSRYYNAYDFMPDFTGTKTLSVDAYGLWSEWWRDFYVRYSRAYTPSQLRVSGPMRPLTRHDDKEEPVGGYHGPVRVLFISEQLAAPEEVMPYLLALLEEPRLVLYFKFRSYRDGFEDWLKAHHPEVLAQVGGERMLRGTMPEATGHTDVTVGSHSTAVLEALLVDKPMVFFDTKKWGDCFSLEPIHATYDIFATNPKQLVEYVLKSAEVPPKALQELKDMFFGDPYLNGSAWAVDELQKHL